MEYFLCFFAWVLVVQNVLASKKNHDPDENRNLAELIESRGFIAEHHLVTTEDEYILGVYRIAFPKEKLSNRKISKPVILQHGLFSSGVDFIINSPGGDISSNILRDAIISNGSIGNNLGFVLANQGYDVWISNSRGNTYSKRHVKLDPKRNREFWDFSFDEMIAYDTPAVISYILNHTGQESLAWVGHSQGSLIMFGFLSTRPEFSEKIKPIIALAPVAHVGYVTSPSRYLAQSWIIQFFSNHGGELLPNSPYFRFFTSKLCSSRIKFFCSNLVLFLFGGNVKQLNESRLSVYAAHDPAGTSNQNVAHFGQMVRSKKFAKFDYGPTENKRRYGTEEPPEYPLEKINSTHIALFSSVGDNLADPTDVAILRSRLKEPLLKDYVISDIEFSHVDFMLSKNAGIYINVQVVDLLKEFDLKNEET